MKAIRFAALLAAACFASLAIADVKTELNAIYSKLNEAMKRKDVAAIMGMCTKDFAWVNRDGTALTRGQMEEQLKMQMKALQKVVDVSVKVQSVSQKGSEWTARTVGSFEADIRLTPDAKKSSRLKSVSTTDDVWVKAGGKWMLKKVKSIKEVTTLDGKPFSTGN